MTVFLYDIITAFKICLYELLYQNRTNFILFFYR